ncbi:hypothetical protein [Flavobacterium sp.]|uniref:hypothetical protein n=1 Tax=Flavobacterium sp. TaxID=239 RepID=UPI003F69B57D
MKNFFLLLVIILTSCTSNKTNYEGQWVNINDYKTIMNITKDGSNYIFELHNRKVVGTEQGDILNVNLEGINSTCAITEDGNLLISNVGEFVRYKKPETDEERINLLKNKILAAIKTNDYRSFINLYVNEYDVNEHYELSKIFQRPTKVWDKFKNKDDGVYVDWNNVKLDLESEENRYELNPEYGKTILTNKLTIPIISGNDKFVMRQNVFIKIGDEFKVCFLDGKVEKR